MALFVLSLCPFDISVGVGVFVIGLGQISSFLSSYLLIWTRYLLCMKKYNDVIRLWHFLHIGKPEHAFGNWKNYNVDIMRPYFVSISYVNQCRLPFWLNIMENYKCPYCKEINKTFMYAIHHATTYHQEQEIDILTKTNNEDHKYHHLRFIVTLRNIFKSGKTRKHKTLKQNTFT